MEIVNRDNKNYIVFRLFETVTNPSVVWFQDLRHVASRGKSQKIAGFLLESFCTLLILYVTRGNV